MIQVIKIFESSLEFGFGRIQLSKLSFGSGFTTKYGSSLLNIVNTISKFFLLFILNALNGFY